MNTTKNSNKKKNGKYDQYTHYFLTKMYKLFKDEPYIFTIKKIKGLHGLCDYVADEIKIDYRKSLIPTIIHEVMHYYYPMWSETKVIKEERKIVNYLSIRQIKNIIKRFANIL